MCCEKDRQYNPEHFEGRVGLYQFADHNCPRYDMIEEFCKDASDWMNQNPNNVCVIHCKAGKGRTGLMICCLLLYIGKCPRAEACMRFYGDMRTMNKKGVTIPSQRRYIHYFDRQLHLPSSVPASQPLTLHRLRIEPIPTDTDTFKPTFLIETFDGEVVLDYGKKLEGQKLPRVHVGESNFIELDCFDTRIDGDVRFIVYTKKKSADKSKTTLLQFWINTRFIISNILTLQQTELDKAVKDKKNKVFPKGFKVSLLFKEKFTPDPAVIEWEKKKSELDHEIMSQQGGESSDEDDDDEIEDFIDTDGNTIPAPPAPKPAAKKGDINPFAFVQATHGTITNANSRVVPIPPPPVASLEEFDSTQAPAPAAAPDQAAADPYPLPDRTPPLHPGAVPYQQDTDYSTEEYPPQE